MVGEDDYSCGDGDEDWWRNSGEYLSGCMASSNMGVIAGSSDGVLFYSSYSGRNEKKALEWRRW